jgi:hypothetical protein
MLELQKVKELPVIQAAIDKSLADIEDMKTWIESHAASMSAEGLERSKAVIAEQEKWTGKHVTFSDAPHCVGCCVHVGLNTLAIRMFDGELWWTTDYWDTCEITDKPLEGKPYLRRKYVIDEHGNRYHEWY